MSKTNQQVLYKLDDQIIYLQPNNNNKNNNNTYKTAL